MNGGRTPEKRLTAEIERRRRLPKAIERAAFERDEARAAAQVLADALQATAARDLALSGGFRLPLSTWRLVERYASDPGLLGDARPRSLGEC